VKFQHSLFEYEKIEQVSENGKRFYKDKNGNKFPSVTTVLSAMSDKTSLLEWSNKVGAENAEKIKTQAARRGTSVHKICEDYLLNNDDYLIKHMPANVSLFKQIKETLDTRVGKIYGIEIPLYSHVLKTAGKCDLVCDFDGILTVGDFKTSTRAKREEWIENYFLQATTYALMVEELYNVDVPNIAILIAVEEDNFQLFQKEKLPFIGKVHEIFSAYHSSHNS
jgi:hypothetical protein